LKLILACKEPKRFSDLLKEIKFSTQGLSLALKKLQEEGILTKTDKGYVLTEKGRAICEEIEVYQLLKKALEIVSAKEIKATLDLAMHLNRFDREVNLIKLYIILLHLKAYVSRTYDMLEFEEEVNHLVGITEEYVSALFPNFEKYHRKIQVLKRLIKERDMSPNAYSEIERYIIGETTSNEELEIEGYQEEKRSLVDDLQKIDPKKLTPQERRLLTLTKILVEKILEKIKNRPIYRGHFWPEDFEIEES